MRGSSSPLGKWRSEKGYSMEPIHLYSVTQPEPVQCNILGKSWNLRPCECWTWFDDYACVCWLCSKRRAGWHFHCFLIPFFCSVLFYYYVRFKPGVTYVSLRGSAVHRDDLWPCFMLCVKSEQIGSANTQTAGTRWPTEQWLRGSAGMWWALVWVTTMRGDQTGTWVGFQNRGQNTEALVQAPLCCWGVSFLTQISPAVFSGNQSGENTRVTRAKPALEHWNIYSKNIHV